MFGSEWMKQQATRALIHGTLEMISSKVLTLKGELTDEDMGIILTVCREAEKYRFDEVAPKAARIVYLALPESAATYN